jgi:hypothetical protein
MSRKIKAIVEKNAGMIKANASVIEAINSLVPEYESYFKVMAGSGELPRRREADKMLGKVARIKA